MYRRRFLLRLSVVASAAALLAFPGAVYSAEDDVPVAAPQPLPVRISGRPVSDLPREIDRLIVQQTPGFAELAAPHSSDAEFLRRVTLDLTGMIPTAKQARDFLADPSSDKRRKTIERLLDSPEYARHMQRTFDVLLMRRLPAKNVPAAALQDFLRTSFAQNRSWDEMTRDLLENDGSDPQNRGPARFYLDRNGEVNEITRDLGRIFLGANLECAQCHDHPEVGDWAQSDYYGISAFLVRSFVFTDAQKKIAVLAEKGEGEVSFESVFEIRDKTSKGAQSIRPKFFGGPELDEPSFAKGEEYIIKPAKDVQPIPRFSRREHLGDAMTSPANVRFARTAANRLWAYLMGRGIVHPLELDHSGNPPSHPELLDLLTERFVASRFDIKFLLREIALSDAYQRSSQQPAGREPSADETFSQAILKPLTPAQFGWAVLQATGEADVQRTALGNGLNEASLYSRLITTEGRFESLFAPPPGELQREFDATASQTLYLSNDPGISALISAKPGNLADRLLKLPADDARALAEELFLSALTRPATIEDEQDVKAYLENVASDQRPRAIEQMIWAVLTSSEFRFNH